MLKHLPSQSPVYFIIKIGPGLIKVSKIKIGESRPPLVALL